MLASILYRSHLNPGEKILHVAHVHPFKIYKRFFKHVFFGLALPWLFYYMMPPFWIAWAAWAGLGVLWLILFFCDWYFDALVVTNQSLIDLEWNGIWNRSSNRIEYHTIEGITYETIGFWGTILNFGNITIDRIGVGKIVGLQAVAFPKTVEREIMEAQSEFLRNKAFKDSANLKDLLSNMMQDYSRFG